MTSADQVANFATCSRVGKFPTHGTPIIDSGRLLGFIHHERGRILALGPKGKRLGSYGSEASARRMIVACAGFRIFDKDAEKRRRRAT